jgi:hypothetical protein
MAQWARNPPSEKRVRLVICVGVIVVAIAMAEYFGVWPEAWTAQPMRP